MSEQPAAEVEGNRRQPGHEGSKQAVVIGDKDERKEGPGVGDEASYEEPNRADDGEALLNSIRMSPLYISRIIPKATGMSAKQSRVRSMLSSLMPADIEVSGIDAAVTNPEQPETGSMDSDEVLIVKQDEKDPFSHQRVSAMDSYRKGQRERIERLIEEHRERMEEQAGSGGLKKDDDAKMDAGVKSESPDLRNEGLSASDDTTVVCILHVIKDQWQTQEELMLCLERGFKVIGKPLGGADMDFFDLRDKRIFRQMIHEVDYSSEPGSVLVMFKPSVDVSKIEPLVSAFSPYEPQVRDESKNRVLLPGFSERTRSFIIGAGGISVELTEEERLEKDIEVHKLKLTGLGPGDCEGMALAVCLRDLGVDCVGISPTRGNGTAVIECAAFSGMQRLLALGTIQVGFSQATVSLVLDDPKPMVWINQCYNCYSYGHTRAQCESEERCRRCGKPGHRAKSGKCSGKAYCGNCKKAGHTAYSDKCPIKQELRRQAEEQRDEKLKKKEEDQKRAILKSMSKEERIALGCFKNFSIDGKDSYVDPEEVEEIEEVTEFDERYAQLHESEQKEELFIPGISEDRSASGPRRKKQRMMKPEKVKEEKKIRPEVLRRDAAMQRVRELQSRASSMMSAASEMTETRQMYPISQPQSLSPPYPLAQSQRAGNTHHVSAPEGSGLYSRITKTKAPRKPVKLELVDSSQAKK